MIATTEFPAPLADVSCCEFMTFGKTFRPREGADFILQNLQYDPRLTVEQARTVSNAEVEILLAVWRFSREIGTADKQGRPDLIREEIAGPNGKTQIVIRPNTPLVNEQQLAQKTLGELAAETAERFRRI